MAGRGGGRRLAQFEALLRSKAGATSLSEQTYKAVKKLVQHDLFGQTGALDTVRAALRSEHGAQRLIACKTLYFHFYDCNNEAEVARLATEKGLAELLAKQLHHTSIAVRVSAMDTLECLCWVEGLPLQVLWPLGIIKAAADDLLAASSSGSAAQGVRLQGVACEEMVVVLQSSCLNLLFSFLHTRWIPGSSAGSSGGSVALGIGDQDMRPAQVYPITKRRTLQLEGEVPTQVRSMLRYIMRKGVAARAIVLVNEQRAPLLEGGKWQGLRMLPNGGVAIARIASERADVCKGAAMLLFTLAARHAPLAQVAALPGLLPVLSFLAGPWLSKAQPGPSTYEACLAALYCASQMLQGGAMSFEELCSSSSDQSSLVAAAVATIEDSVWCSVGYSPPMYAPLAAVEVLMAAALRQPTRDTAWRAHPALSPAMDALLNVACGRHIYPATVSVGHRCSAAEKAILALLAAHERGGLAQRDVLDSLLCPLVNALAQQVEGVGSMGTEVVDFTEIVHFVLRHLHECLDKAMMVPAVAEVYPTTQPWVLEQLQELMWSSGLIAVPRGEGIEIRLFRERSVSVSKQEDMKKAWGKAARGRD